MYDILNEVKDIQTYNRSFLKWAGGKTKILTKILKHFKPSERFVEPFFGGGSVFLNIQYNKCLINDINPDMTLIWSCVKERGPFFLERCCSLFTEENNKKDRYYELREKFNQLEKNKKSKKHDVERASLFLYLNKHCWNGLCRYSTTKDGFLKFNVPYANYKTVNCPKDKLDFCQSHLNNHDIQIENKDFREIFDMVNPGDMIYCDPPYVPISDTSYFTEYAGGTFTEKDQQDLLDLSLKAVEKGCKVIISNSLCDKTLDLYHGLDYEEIKVTRNIGGGGIVKELIVSLGQ